MWNDGAPTSCPREDEHDARISDPDENEPREGCDRERAHDEGFRFSGDTLEKVDGDVT